MTCYSYPGRPAITAVPAHAVSTPVLAWDAGANSETVESGGCSLTFTMPVPAIGVVVGLKGDRVTQSNPNKIQFGLMFQRQNGSDWYNVVENGVARTSMALRVGALDETFEIRRVGYRVAYLVNGITAYVSAIYSFGDLLANGCLYASLDSIG